ncbi:TetR/AcrR family transcriptional regulator [Ruegeria sediminis]|uniref:TetR/AcrR family transcriptional regulator n=1 Tax=Ruegeria sediminis TaxID=2583820 RepID=A0ABY2WZP4_9RHOB|nr:TetR/AcrR family transcriptional regulator [Ruegeria sediminis]TMV07952.1 TetR/AcrR family transcriptional regulator [Ruegeria sediminis]
MKDAHPDPRQQAILSSAWQAFATYGFRKTSMDDIARGAGMSRPAVYLHYRNKEAIFRSLVEHFYQEKTEAVAECLNGPGTIPEVLGRAMAAQSDGIAALLASPHGLELLDAGSSTAPDIVAAGEAGLRDLYAGWLDREAGKGRVRFSGPSQAIAGMITAALKGIKITAQDIETYTERVSAFAILIGAGLEVR